MFTVTFFSVFSSLFLVFFTLVALLSQYLFSFYFFGRHWFPLINSHILSYLVSFQYGIIVVYLISFSSVFFVFSSFQRFFPFSSFHHIFIITHHRSTYYFLVWYRCFFFSISFSSCFFLLLAFFRLPFLLSFSILFYLVVILLRYRLSFLSWYYFYY